MIQGKAQIEEATGGSLGGAALAHWEVREKGPWGQDQGASLVRAAATPCSPGCKSRGDPWGLGDTSLWGKKGVDVLPGGKASCILYTFVGICEEHYVQCTVC